MTASKGRSCTGKHPYQTRKTATDRRKSMFTLTLITVFAVAVYVGYRAAR